MNICAYSVLLFFSSADLRAKGALNILPSPMRGRYLQAMGNFYIDDSIHDEAGFIIGACVYSKHDLSANIAEILSHSGYDPSFSEFIFRI
jgi:hypothetical protein